MGTELHNEHKHSGGYRFRRSVARVTLVAGAHLFVLELFDVTIRRRGGHRQHEKM